MANHVAEMPPRNLGYLSDPIGSDGVTPLLQTTSQLKMWWTGVVLWVRIVTQSVSASPEIVTGDVAFPPNVTFVTDNPTISFTSDLPLAAPLNSSL